jgi:hypothetical protein
MTLRVETRSANHTLCDDPVAKTDTGAVQAGPRG